MVVKKKTAKKKAVKKQKLNVELLERVKKHILEEPNRMLMGTWIYRASPGSLKHDYCALLKVPECGTIGCIAGWTCLLGKGMDYNSDRTDTFADTEARDLLGLKQIPNELFYAHLWKDSGLFYKFSTSRDPKERAEIVVKVIDQFIESKTKKRKQNATKR